MVLINGKPILLRIMNFYAKQGFKDFYIALGYRNYIKKYFKNKSLDGELILLNWKKL